ncbi:MAG: hypothetical protein PHY14_00125 [Candidatus Gracilibacteria bacterium]|nr:hypothetical protein [Candidatus Gracilibacteria bacterium]
MISRKKKLILEKGIEGSIKKQESVFSANFITRALLRRADKLGKKKNAF